MKYNPLTRRIFLQGAGGFLLSTPWLPSLFTSKAYAQNISPKRLISIFTRNGTYHPAWYPTVGATQLIGNARERRLTDVAGPISEILGDAFTPLKNKLLLVRGLDGLHTGGHNVASMLGANCGHGDGSYTSQNITMDQILAHSNKIYMAAPRMRVLSMAATNSNNAISFYKSGTDIVKQSATYDPRAIFEKIFGLTAGLDSSQIVALKAQRKSVVDRVYEDYKKVINSKRISTQDKRVLEDHLASISDIQKKIQGISTETNFCTENPAPKSVTSTNVMYDNPDPTAHAEYLSSLIDLVVLSLRCDMTRVVSFHFCHRATRYGFLGVTKDHHSISHNNSDEGRLAATKIDHYQGTKIAELIAKLDNVETNTGRTLLDESLVFWGHEFSGTAETNHKNEDMPVLLAGGAGFLNMGRYVDYRRPGVKRSNHAFSEAGMPYNQLLVTIAQGFGLTPAEYEQGKPGFGDYRDKSWSKYYDLSDAAKRTPLHRLLK